MRKRRLPPPPKKRLPNSAAVSSPAPEWVEELEPGPTVLVTLDIENFPAAVVQHLKFPHAYQEAIPLTNIEGPLPLADIIGWTVAELWTKVLKEPVNVASLTVPAVVSYTCAQVPYRLDIAEGSFGFYEGDALDLIEQRPRNWAKRVAELAHQLIVNDRLETDIGHVFPKV